MSLSLNTDNWIIPGLSVKHVNHAGFARCAQPGVGAAYMPPDRNGPHKCGPYGSAALQAAIKTGASWMRHYAGGAAFQAAIKTGASWMRYYAGSADLQSAIRAAHGPPLRNTGEAWLRPYNPDAGYKPALPGGGRSMASPLHADGGRGGPPHRSTAFCLLPSAYFTRSLLPISSMRSMATRARLITSGSSTTSCSGSGSVIACSTRRSSVFFI
jgi:hypothetical protein